MSNYLDEQGLALLWGKIVNKFNSYVPHVSSLDGNDINEIYNQTIDSVMPNSQDENLAENTDEP